MTKADLVEKVQAAHSGLSKRQVALVVETVFDHLARGIRKDKRFSMPGFGTFVVNFFSSGSSGLGIMDQVIRDKEVG